VPSDRYIPKGAASLQISADGPAREFYFLLLPKLTMLAFSSAIEPLRIANQLAQKQLYTWYAITPDGQGATCSNGVTIQSDGAMGQISKEASVFVCSGIDPIRPHQKRCWDGSGNRIVRAHKWVGFARAHLRWRRLVLFVIGDLRCTGKTNLHSWKPSPIWFQLKTFMKMMVN
jgi:hypothetical protein